MSETDLSSQIADAAALPEEITGDAGRVRERPLKDLIEADRYLAERNAASQGSGAPFRIMKISPPGA